MSDVRALNGYILYNSFISGYENLLKHKNRLNDINVFPVADGDTGNNMVSTFYSTIQVPAASRSVSLTMHGIADRALSGARGNSGIIVAQFLNALAVECADKETMTTREFGKALQNAAAHTYSAIENPQEGTLITIFRIWSDEMFRLGELLQDFREVFSRSIHAARLALERTRDQLAVLKNAGVVDAGASGFVSFLDGVVRMIAAGVVPPKRMAFPLSVEDEEESMHDAPESADTITFKYCTEALVLRRRSDAGTLPAASTALRQALSGLGDSLMISQGRDKLKIHIHTDEPARLFLVLKDYGRVIEQKVDDMRMQFNAAHHPVSRIAIVTDSIADIPHELLDRYQIHVIPQKILWGDDEYLDRLTISAETFYPYLDSRVDYPSSSVPDPHRVDQVFSWLASHYESIIAIPVGKLLSGTWQVMRNSADKLAQHGYPVAVVDSKLNSAAQGLVVLAAAEDAAAGLAHEDILRRMSANIAKARILVSVATFRYMVRGGRVSALKGFFAALTNLKPIVSLDQEGKGTAFGASFSQEGSERKMLRSIGAHRASISRYAVVHAGVPERARRYADELGAILGSPPEYIMEISPVVGIHAGIGAVGVAYL
ncbi:MAG TPA: DegV family protein [bacterium]|nr:DegV family protein [bacterium]